MPLLDLHHVAIKTLDLEATNDFYTEVLGMEVVDRPPFDFPGTWLNMGSTMVHIMAGHAAYDKDGKFSPGGAAVDHIALRAQDFDGMKKTVAERGLPWRQLSLPSAGLWQLFVKDPNGVLIELNFAIADEPKGARGPDGTLPYQPGQF